MKLNFKSALLIISILSLGSIIQCADLNSNDDLFSGFDVNLLQPAHMFDFSAPPSSSSSSAASAMDVDPEIKKRMEAEAFVIAAWASQSGTNLPSLGDVPQPATKKQKISDDKVKQLQA